MYIKERIHQLEVNVSEILESHGIPDTYTWRINDLGKIVPENSDTPVENIIFRNNHIAQLEFAAFLKIQEKALSMQEGDYVLWISPRHPVYYPDASKIIITVKEKGNLVNRSINTNWDILESILIAQELASMGDLDRLIFQNADCVRTNPIFINANKKEELGLAIKRILDARVIQMVNTGEDVRLKKIYMSYTSEGRNVPMGQNPLSCPTLMADSAFNVFTGRDEYGSLQFECPHCHRTNTRERGKLLEKCQYEDCKKDVRCKPSYQ